MCFWPVAEFASVKATRRGTAMSSKTMEASSRAAARGTSKAMKTIAFHDPGRPVRLMDSIVGRITLRLQPDDRSKGSLLASAEVTARVRSDAAGAQLFVERAAARACVRPAHKLSTPGPTFGSFLQELRPDGDLSCAAGAAHDQLRLEYHSPERAVRIAQPRHEQLRGGDADLPGRLGHGSQGRLER